MAEKLVSHPILLGIVGDSAAGKTTLSAGIAAILGPELVAVLCADDYHRYSRAQRAQLGITALHPDANYVDILEQHLQLLRQGRPVLKPVYNHHDGTLDPPEYVAPRDYIIVEGLLGYTTRAMRDCYDVKIYLEPDEALRVQWKCQRDTARRGYTREQVMEELRKREADTKAFIQPQRLFTDLVISFYPPNGAATTPAEHLSARLILRPTLPHPDLAPVLNDSANPGLRIELSRDKDGKPVDILEIDGAISDRRAERLENLLWELIPEASHLRGNVGSFEKPDDRKSKSHPLALTQLLVTYYMIKAAMGIHAV